MGDGLVEMRRCRDEPHRCARWSVLEIGKIYSSSNCVPRVKSALESIKLIIHLPLHRLHQLLDRLYLLLHLFLLALDILKLALDILLLALDILKLAGDILNLALDILNLAGDILDTGKNSAALVEVRKIV